jgi:excinuclease UvrABC nuclease subunit
MKLASQNLQFEKAAEYRDQISEIRLQKEKVALSGKLKKI